MNALEGRLGLGVLPLDVHRLSLFSVSQFNRKLLLEFWLEKSLEFWLEIPHTKKVFKNG